MAITEPIPMMSVSAADRVNAGLRRSDLQVVRPTDAIDMVQTCSDWESGAYDSEADPVSGASLARLIVDRHRGSTRTRWRKAAPIGAAFLTIGRASYRER